MNDVCVSQTATESVCVLMMRLFCAVLPLKPDIVVNVPNSCLLSWLKSKTRAVAAKVSDASPVDRPRLVDKSRHTKQIMELFCLHRQQSGLRKRITVTP